MVKFVSDWYKMAQSSAEPEWRMRLEVLGVNQVRQMILDSNADKTISVPSPIIIVNPETRMNMEISPTVEYAITWINKKNEDENTRRKTEIENTVKIQRTALIISVLGALATVANVIRLFFK